MQQTTFLGKKRATASMAICSSHFEGIAMTEVGSHDSYILADLDNQVCDAPLGSAANAENLAGQFLEGRISVSKKTPAGQVMILPARRFRCAISDAAKNS